MFQVSPAHKLTCCSLICWINRIHHPSLNYRKLTFPTSIYLRFELISLKELLGKGFVHYFGVLANWKQTHIGCLHMFNSYYIYTRSTIPTQCKVRACKEQCAFIRDIQCITTYHFSKIDHHFDICSCRTDFVLGQHKSRIRRIEMRIGMPFTVRSAFLLFV